MDSYEWILEELKRALYSVEKEERVQLKQKLLQAKRVYIAGMGRSGLIAGCFAMRLANNSNGYPARGFTVNSVRFRKYKNPGTV